MSRSLRVPSFWPDQTPRPNRTKARARSSAAARGLWIRWIQCIISSNNPTEQHVAPYEFAGHDSQKSQGRSEPNVPRVRRAVNGRSAARVTREKNCYQSYRAWHNGVRKGLGTVARIGPAALPCWQDQSGQIDSTTESSERNATCLALATRFGRHGAVRLQRPVACGPSVGSTRPAKSRKKLAPVCARARGRAAEQHCSRGKTRRKQDRQYHNWELGGRRSATSTTVLHGTRANITKSLSTQQR